MAASVAGLELGQQLRIMHRPERLRNIVLEKLDVVRHLLQRHLGVHLGRIADVLPRRFQHPGNLTLASDYGAETIGRGGEIPPHDEEDSVTQVGDINVWVFSPHLDVLQFQKPRLDGRSQDLQIAGRFLGEVIALNRTESFLELQQFPRFLRPFRNARSLPACRRIDGNPPACRRWDEIESRNRNTHPPGC